MNPEEMLRTLLSLQGVDKEVYDHERELESIPERKKELDAQYSAGEAALKGHDKRLKDVQVAKKSKELDLDKKEGDIKKRETQLYQAKTNKEYTAIETEIKGLKADNSLLEDDILKAMDDIEAAEKALKEEQARLADVKKKVDSEKSRLDRRKAELEEALAKLNKKRSAILPGIDKSILARYERVLKGREGMAMAPTKGETCGGCFYNLPPQVINEVRMLAGLVFCDHCSRLLYPEEWAV